jgi:hypothetical protein
VKITASGYYHLRFLTARTEYLANIAFDTPLLGPGIGKQMSRLREDSKQHSFQRIELLGDNLNSQVEAIEEFRKDYQTQSFGHQTLRRNFNRALSGGQVWGEPDSGQTEMDI